MKNKCITDFQLEEGEELKTIPGFERYKASNMGRIISYVYPDNPKLLQASCDKSGYPQVALMKDGKRISIKVSRVVAMAWIENPESKEQVDHINTIKTDNRVCNLRWVTASENQHNQLSYEKNTKRLQQMAIERSQAVYVYTKDYEIVSAFTSTSNAAKECGWSQGNISSCCQGTLPTYKGLIWSYNSELTKEKREELLTEKKDIFIRNRISTYKAVEKYRHKPENVLKARQKANEWYANNPERAKERQRRYYERVKQRREESTKTEILPGA